MYGYVVPEKAELGQADFCLYRAFYCGICMATKRMFGQFPRFTTNYDMVFLSILLHDYNKQEVEFQNRRCICNPKRKTVVCGNALFDKLVAANILLAYHKAEDDVIDGGGIKKRAVRKMLRKHYRKAAQTLPEAEAIVTHWYGELRAYEQAGEKSVDRVSHCFASLLRELGLLLSGADDPTLGTLLYNVGKFVYLADALDDVDEDHKKKRYNPLLAALGNFTSRKQFIADNRDSLTFMLASTVNRAIACFNALTFTGASDLLRNVVYKGLRGKCEQLLGSDKKLPLPKI